MKFRYFRCSLGISLILVYMAGVPLSASSNAIGDADRDLFRYIHEDLENGFFDATLPTLQRMGHSQTYTATCMLLCAFGDEKMVQTGKLATTGFLGAGFLAYTLKEIIGRPRPLNEDEENSFPSGHATLAFTMATIAGYKYPDLRMPLYAGALITAFSRVYLGRHYPSDVVAGAIMGTFVSIGVILYRKPILRLSL